MQNKIALLAAAAVGSIILALFGTPQILPIWAAVLLYILTPFSNIPKKAYAYAPAAILLAALSEASFNYSILLVLPALVALLLPFNKVSVPFITSAGVSIIVFHSSPMALAFGLLVAFAATASSMKLSQKTQVYSVVGFIISAMLLVTSAASAALSQDFLVPAALAVLASVVLMVASAAAMKSSAPTPRLLSALACAFLLAIPTGFVSNNNSSDEVAPGILASPNLLDCPELGNDTIKAVECYSAVLIDEYRTNGLADTVALVGELYNAPAPLGSHFAENCHESLHFLGKAAALDRTGDLRETISEGTDMCAAGFGHGIWEMEYGAMTTEDLVNDTPTICRGWDGLNRSEEGSAGIGCRHILGHTLATRFRGHIEDVAPVCLVRDPQVDQSSELSNDETISQNNCLAGLFMENFLDLNRFRTKDVDSQNPFATCEAPKITKDERLMWGCYNEVGAMVVPWTDYDMNKSLRACKEQAEKYDIPEFVKVSCYDSISRSIGPALAYDSPTMEGACAGVDPGELQTYCVKGIAAAIAFNSNDIALATKICQTNLPDKEGQEICLERIREVSAQLGASKVAADADSQTSGTSNTP
jgi:hypothetical protein